MKHRRLVIALGALMALIVLIGTAALALAQGPEPPVEGNPPFFGFGRWSHGGMWGGRGGGMHGFSLVEATAEATGLSVDEVTAALREGQTFVEIAEGEGVDLQAIADAFVAQRQAALEEMAEHVLERLQAPWSPPRPFGGGMWRGSGRGMHGYSLVEAAAEATGLDVDEVLDALREGQTYAEIAEAEGTDTQAILDAFAAQCETALEEAVAQGWLTQEQAMEMLESMTERASEQLEQPWSWAPFGGPMGRGAFGCDGGRGMGFGSRFFRHW